MSTTLHDLRHAWGDTVRRAYASAGEDEDAEVDVTVTETPPDPAEDSDVEDGSEDEEEVNDPDAKVRSEEAKRYRIRAKQEKQRADQAEATLGTTRMELAFYRAALGHPERITDVDAAFKLADLSIVRAEGGAYTGLDAALTKVVERYPYLTDEDTPAPVQRDEPLVASGRKMNPKRATTDGDYDTAALVKKFPALARRVGR